MIVPQVEEVELELEAIAIAVLQVDGPLIVLALVVLFSRSLSWWHVQGSFRGV